MLLFFEIGKQLKDRCILHFLDRLAVRIFTLGYVTRQLSSFSIKIWDCMICDCISRLTENLTVCSSFQSVALAAAEHTAPEVDLVLVITWIRVLWLIPMRTEVRILFVRVYVSKRFFKFVLNGKNHVRHYRYCNLWIVTPRVHFIEFGILTVQSSALPMISVPKILNQNLWCSFWIENSCKASDIFEVSTATRLLLKSSKTL